MVVLRIGAVAAWAIGALVVAQDVEVPEHVVADEACQADDSSEECALSLRQLRGQKLGSLTAAEEEESGFHDGFCCLWAGSPGKDTCGVCYKTSYAPQGTYCASSRHCGKCGGTWCQATCVYSGSDSSNVCGTAHATSIVEKGFCAESGGNCGACKGKWCAANYSTSLRNPGKKAAEEAAIKAAPVDEEDSTNGFCCHHASGGNTCGSCKATEMAAAGSFCASRNKCGGCGGTWCTETCVYSSSDPSNACGTARELSIAMNGFCSKSDSNCASCNGTFCPAANFSTVPDLEVKTAVKEPEEAEDADGFCCHYSSSAKDACGSCQPTERSIVGSFCASKDKCGGCGGQWCQRKCVFSGTDDDDLCGTAYDSAIAGEGHVCSTSEGACTKCKGTWCSANYSSVLKAAPVKEKSWHDDDDDLEPPSDDDEDEEHFADEEEQHPDTPDWRDDALEPPSDDSLDLPDSLEDDFDE